MDKKQAAFLSNWADACKRKMQKCSELHKTFPLRKGRKSKNRVYMETARPGWGGRRICGWGGLWRAQRSELVAALVLPVHCQLAISGRSTPCAAMYCRCSTSLSRICCTA